MTNNKEEAETLRLGLLFGYVTVSDVIRWADEVISRQESPEPAVIEVALAGHRSAADMVVLLREVPGQADPIRVRRRLLGLLLRVFARDSSQGERIAQLLYKLAISGELPEEEFGLEPYSIDDAFELARHWVCGTMDMAREDLRLYLERHADVPRL